MHTITPAMMVHTAFQNRERGFFHTSHEDESAPFFLMVNGETERMLEAMRSLWKPEGAGKLSSSLKTRCRMSDICSLQQSHRPAVSASRAAWTRRTPTTPATCTFEKWMF